jgi:hypothetical protein
MGTISTVANPDEGQTGYLSIQENSDVPETTYVVTTLDG